MFICVNSWQRFFTEMAKLIITIDGPAGSGKSSVARLLANQLDASFLDTGAMYRAVTLASMQAKVDMKNENELLDILNSTNFDFAAKKEQMQVSINGIDVTEKIRNKKVTANAHYIASSAKVRQRLVQMQQSFAAQHKKIVTEGRDQGTVVFADADVKFYLTADIKERARRRHAELKDTNNIEQIMADIEKRDSSDQSREVAPMKPAEDAIIVDTTKLTLAHVVEKLFEYVKNIITDFTD